MRFTSRRFSVSYLMAPCMADFRRRRRRIHVGRRLGWHLLFGLRCFRRTCWLGALGISRRRRTGRRPSLRSRPRCRLSRRLRSPSRLRIRCSSRRCLSQSMRSCREAGCTQVAALVLMAALCLLRIQFSSFPLAYLVATSFGKEAPGEPCRAHPAAFLGAGLLGLVGVVVASTTFYSGVRSHLPDTLRIWPWIAIDAFRLAIAAGWVIVPGAVVGFARACPLSTIHGDGHSRRWRSISTALIVLEAAYFDAGPAPHSRAIHLLCGASARGRHVVCSAIADHKDVAYKVLAAYACRGSRSSVPATSWFHDADAESGSRDPRPADVRNRSRPARLGARVRARLRVALAQSRRYSWACLPGAVVAGGSVRRRHRELCFATPQLASRWHQQHRPLRTRRAVALRSRDLGSDGSVRPHEDIVLDSWRRSGSRPRRWSRRPTGSVLSPSRFGRRESSTAPGTS